jgi:predicted neuraminidase
MKKTYATLSIFLLIQWVCAARDPIAASGQSLVPHPSLIKSEFIFVQPTTPSCHASTIAETEEGLVVAWFGGPHERHPQVAIWVSRHDQRGWTVPAQVADGLQADASTRYPCWNPVLFQAANGPLLLFFKVGPSPSRWWGMLTKSFDNGRTWSKPHQLPRGFIGPVRNKPIQLPDGSLLCGASTERKGWKVHMERTPDLGWTWERSPDLNAPEDLEAIQPTILKWLSGAVQILNRTKQGRISECWMGDNWTYWSPMKATGLPNPNSAIDAVVLKDGRALLVYNHTSQGRSPLNVSLSSDGKSWQGSLVLENEPGEYSYPAVVQSADGLVHITYTWKRQRIKHAVIDPQKLPFDLRAHSIITSHFGISPSGYLCPMPHSQNPRNS